MFSCESNADVERWCDVLNKAALGFIIQPSPRPEKGIALQISIVRLIQFSDSTPHQQDNEHKDG